MEKLFKINYSKENYFKDFLKWYCMKNKKIWYIIIVSFAIFVFVSINYIELLLFDFYETNIYIFSQILLFFIIIIYYEIKGYLNEKSSLFYSSQQFDYGIENLIIKSAHIEFTYKLDKDILFFSQIERLIDCDNIMFFELKRKSSYPFRLNKNEISVDCYKNVLEVLKIKHIKIKEIVQYTAQELEAYKDRLVAGFDESYTGKGETVNFKGVLNLEFATDDKPLTKTDHAIRIVDQGNIPDGKGGFRPNGVTEGRFKGRGKTSRGLATFERTGPHELGHSGNLKHPAVGTEDGNLMHQTKQPNAGIKITEKQVLKIEKNHKAGKLNKGKQ